MSDFFKYATPVTYALIAAIWLYILIFSIKKMKENKKEYKLLSLLLLIISIDAFRTIFEGIFFGIRQSSQAGFISISVYNFLSQAEYVFLPKLITLITGLLVLILVLNRWLPTEIKQKKVIEDLINSKNSELIQKNKELEKAKNKAEESDTLKTEFLKNISHEIRTPMNGIQGFSNFLLNPDLEPEKRIYYAKIIQSSSEQLLQIINDILEISTLGTQQVNVQTSSFNLNELLLELTTLHNLKAIEKGIHLSFEEAHDQIIMINSDRTKLSKILNNLIDNAIKFTLDGSVKIGYHIHNDSIEIYIKDTGIGIDKEHQRNVFERFVQEEKELSKQYDGLGLGLAIAKGSAKLIGAEIKLKSEKGIGSTFTLILPYKS